MQTGLLKAAYDMLRRHGISCTYNSVTNGSYDIATQSVVASSSVSTDIIAYMSENMYLDKSSPDLVLNSYSTILISGIDAETVGINPKLGDTILYDSDTYQVKKIIKHRANQKVALYRLLVVK